MNNRTALANSIRASRLKEIRVVLDSFRRRGATQVHAREIARTMGLLSHLPVMELGRERIDDLQPDVDGVVVIYARGIFSIERRT